MKIITNILIASAFFFLLTSYTNKTPHGSIKLVKAEKATYIYLFQNLNFSLNEIKIEESCKSQLFLILKYLKENPKLIIEISVHSSFRTKKDLSQIRATVLKDFFVKYGIDSNRIHAVGYKTTKYINHCKYIKRCTKKQQESNRRIQFQILNPEVLKDYIIVQK